MPPTAPTGRRVALVTLGCGRNEVDSEELAGRLAADGWLLVPEAADADVAVVNTCGFVEAAKKDSVDTLLAAADLKGGGRTQAVVAVGCLAERYGEQLAAALPEADAVLGFDDYADISARLGSILDGERARAAHAAGPPHAAAARPGRPQRRPRAAARRPARPDLPDGVAPASGPQPLRMRLGDGPTAALKLASRLRPALHVLRDPDLPRLVRVAAPARGARRGRLAGRAGRARARPGERELDVVRQGPRRPAAARDAAARAGGGRRRRAGPGQLPAAGRDAARPDRGDDDDARRRCRTSTCPSSTPAARCCAGCAGSATPSASSSWSPAVRAAAPTRASGPTSSSASPARPRPTWPSSSGSWSGRGSTWSASSATPTRTAPRRRRCAGKLSEDVVHDRVERITRLAEELVAQRAEERVGEVVEVLVEEVDAEAGTAEGRAAHQGPEVDGSTTAARRRSGCRSGRSSPPRSSPARALTWWRGDVAARPAAPQASAWNIANALTVLRMVLVPVFLVLLFHDDGEDDAWRVLAFVVVRGGLGDRPDRRRDRPQARAGHRLRQDRRPDRRQGADRRRADRPVAARRAALVGHGRRPGPRDRRHAAAVLRDPARRDAGQPRRQGQDAAAGAGHRPARSCRWAASWTTWRC